MLSFPKMITLAPLSKSLFELSSLQTWIEDRVSYYLLELAATKGQN